MDLPVLAAQPSPGVRRPAQPRSATAGRRRTIRCGGAARSSTRSTSAASPTGTATASATWPVCASTSATSRDLGVDAIWFTPWYESPLADGGYDVADYRTHQPRVRRPGRSGGADPGGAASSASARSSTSCRTTSPTGIPGSRRRWPPVPASPERERFWFRPGTRDPTATRCRPTGCPTSPARPGRAPPTPTARPASGTCTCSRRSSPTSTGTIRTSGAEHEDILRFWFDRGVAGVRIDSAALLVKDATLPEVPERSRARASTPTRTATSCTTSTAAGARSPTRYPGTRVLVGELWLPDIDRFAMYLRPDELHTAFNFDFLARPWDARELRASIDETLAAHAPVNAPSAPGCCPTTT